MRSSGAQRKPAIAVNLAFIQQERRHLRERLAAAARDAKLSYTDGPVLGDFVFNSRKEAVEEELIDLDPEGE